MILYRVLPFDRRVAPVDPGGALWWPRVLQGSGRHDNPDLYGCMYVSESPVSAVAEALAPFRSTGQLAPEMLIRAGTPLAIAELALDGGEEALVDLDDPTVLAREELSPSRVATSDRLRTQAWARDLYGADGDAAGLRWWSTLEASWINVTLFDRAAQDLDVAELHILEPGDETVVEAAELLGLG